MAAQAMGWGRTPLRPTSALPISERAVWAGHSPQRPRGTVGVRSRPSWSCRANQASFESGNQEVLPWALRRPHRVHELQGLLQRGLRREGVDPSGLSHTIVQGGYWHGHAVHGPLDSLWCPLDSFCPCSRRMLGRLKRDGYSTRRAEAGRWFIPFAGHIAGIRRGPIVKEAASGSRALRMAPLWPGVGGEHDAAIRFVRCALRCHGVQHPVSSRKPGFGSGCEVGQHDVRDHAADIDRT